MSVRGWNVEKERRFDVEEVGVNKEEERGWFIVSHFRGQRTLSPIRNVNRVFRCVPPLLTTRSSLAHLTSSYQCIIIPSSIFYLSTSLGLSPPIDRTGANGGSLLQQS